MSTSVSTRASSIRRATAVAGASVLLVAACLAEGERPPAFRSDADVVVEPLEPPSEPAPLEHGGENAGVERPLTITPQGVSQLLVDGQVEPQLQQQAVLAYACPSITDQAELKVEAVTGEVVASSELIDGDVVGATASFDFRVSSSRDRLYIVDRAGPPGEPASAVVPEAVIEQQAVEDLAALQIPLGAGQALTVDQLMRAPSDDPSQAEPVAYKVFVELELEGHPVIGPRAVLSYGLDGALQKISARWPAVTGSDPAILVPWSGVEDAVYTALLTHPLGAETHALTARARLVVADGLVRQAVAVSGLLSAGPGGVPPSMDDDTGRLGELMIPL